MAVELLMKLRGYPMQSAECGRVFWHHVGFSSFSACSQLGSIMYRKVIATG